MRAARGEILKLGTEAARTAAARERLQTELYVMPVTGGTPKRLRTAGTETAVQWSPGTTFSRIRPRYGGRSCSPASTLRSTTC